MEFGFFCVTFLTGTPGKQAITEKVCAAFLHSSEKPSNTGLSDISGLHVWKSTQLHFVLYFQMIATIFIKQAIHTHLSHPLAFPSQSL